MWRDGRVLVGFDRQEEPPPYDQTSDVPSAWYWQPSPVPVAHLMATSADSAKSIEMVALAVALA